MKSKDWFAVGIRLFGVWMLIQALAESVILVQLWAGWVTPLHTSFHAYVFHGAVELVVGLYMLMGAPLIMSLSGLKSVSDRSCPECGYDLRESHERCPECGTAIDAAAADKKADSGPTGMQER